MAGKEIIELINLLVALRLFLKTRLGLCLLLFLAISVTWPFIDDKISISVLSLYFAAIVGFVALPWVYWSTLIINKRQKNVFTVAIAVSSNRLKGFVYIADLIYRLKILLAKEDLRIITVGSDAVADDDNAFKIIKRKQADLVIKGASQVGNENGKELFSCHPINFYCKAPIPAQHQLELKFFGQSFRSGLAGRKLYIYEQNSHGDTDRAATNLAHSIAFGVALIRAYDEEERHKSARSLEHLREVFIRELKSLEQLEGESDEDLEIVRNRAAHATLYLRRVCLGLANAFVHSKDYRTGLFWYRKGAELGYNDIDFVAGLARTEYLVGNKQEARRITNEIGKQQRNHPIYMLNSAYLAIDDKDYNKAASLYLKVKRYYEKLSEPLIVSILDFLEIQIMAQNEPALLFSKAFVLSFLGKVAEAKLLCVQFIADVENKQEYAEMKALAERFRTFGMWGVSAGKPKGTQKSPGKRRKKA